MKDESKLHRFHESLGKYYDVPDYDTFKNDMWGTAAQQQPTGQTGAVPAGQTTSAGEMVAQAAPPVGPLTPEQELQEFTRDVRQWNQPTPEGYAKDSAGRYGSTRADQQGNVYITPESQTPEEKAIQQRMTQVGEIYMEPESYSFEPDAGDGKMHYSWRNGRRIGQLDPGALRFAHIGRNYSSDAYKQAEQEAAGMTDDQLRDAFNGLYAAYTNSGDDALTQGYGRDDASRMMAYATEMRYRDVGMGHAKDYGNDGQQSQTGVYHYHAARMNPAVSQEMDLQDRMGWDQRVSYLSGALKDKQARENAINAGVGTDEDRKALEEDRRKLLAGSMLYARDNHIYPEDAYRIVVGAANNATPKDSGFWAGFTSTTSQMWRDVKYFIGEAANLIADDRGDILDAISALDKYGNEADTKLVAGILHNLGLLGVMLFDGDEAGASEGASRILSECIVKGKDGRIDVDATRAALLRKLQTTYSWGDRTMRDNIYNTAMAKQVEGNAAWWGQQVAQLVPTTAAIVVGITTRNPALAESIGQLGMGYMCISSGSQAMQEARMYGANDNQVWTAGIVNAALEYLTERIPFDRYTKRVFGEVKAASARKLMDAVVDVNNPAHQEIQQLLESAMKELGTNKGRIAKAYTGDVLAEGSSEFVAGVLQKASEILYKNPEDYPTFMEILDEGVESFKGGAAMGGIMSGVSNSATYAQADNRRKKAGIVSVGLYEGEDGMGVPVEIIDHDSAGNYIVLDGQHRELIVRPGKLKGVTTYTYDEWKRGEVQQEEDKTYNQGYNAQGEEREQVQSDLQRTEQRLDEMGFDMSTFDGWTGDTFEEAIKGQEGNYTDEELSAIREYFSAKAASDGMQQRIEDDIDTQVQQASDLVDRQTNQGTGMVHRAVLNNGQEVYVTGGQLVMTGDGTMIDTEASDESLFVYNPATGQPEQYTPSDFQSVDDPINPEQLKSEAARDIRQAVEQQAEADMNGYVQQGGAYDMVDEQGNALHGTVLELEPDNTAVVQVDGEQIPVTIPTQQLQTWVDNAKQIRMSMEPAALPTRGNEGQATDADTGRVGNAKNETIEAPSVEPMVMDEQTGEPAWLQSTPERGYQYLVNESGLIGDDITSLIDDRIAQAEAAIEKSSKGGTIDQRLQARQAKDYWDGVKAVHQAAMAQPTATGTTALQSPTGQPTTTGQTAPAGTVRVEAGQAETMPVGDVPVNPDGTRADDRGQLGIRREDTEYFLRTMSPRVMGMLDKVAKSLGWKIRLYNGEDANERGHYLNGVVWVNRRAMTSKLAQWILGHEMTHGMGARTGRGETFNGYITLANNYHRRQVGDERYEQEIDGLIKAYQDYLDNNGYDSSVVDRTYIEEEIACDVTGDLLMNNPEMIGKLFSGVDSPGKVKRIIDMIVDALNWLKSKLPWRSEERQAFDDLIMRLNNLYRDAKAQTDIAKATALEEGSQIDNDDNEGAGGSFSITGNTEGSGFTASETVMEVWRVPQEDWTYKEEEHWVKRPLLDSDGNVVFRMGGREYNGNNPITVDDLKSNPDTILNYMLADALRAGTIDETKADQVRQQYADMLNMYLEKGLAENGGFENLENNWLWVGETVYRTVASNSDEQYSYSIDITKVCKKNEAVIRAISAMQVKSGYGVTPAQILEIYEATDAEGFQVPCPVCYVFSRYINNGKYATAIVNGMKKYGKYLPGQPGAWSVDDWVKEMKAAQARAEKMATPLKNANEDVKVILQQIDALCREITSGKLSKEEAESKRRHVRALDQRYRAALNVISQEAIPRWIKSFVLEGSDQGGWSLREDAALPEDMDDFTLHALDIRKTASAMEKYPALTRYRRAGGSAGGKEITFSSNNELGTIIMGLGISKDKLDDYPNYYQLAAEAETDEERQALLQKARERFDKARLYVQRQTLRGGQRMWSWSDNIESLSSDVASNLMQLELLGGALQTYSKQLEGVKMVAAMNGYINASLMGYGDGIREVGPDEIENGRLKDDIWDVNNKGRRRIIANAGSPVYHNAADGKDYVLVFDDVVGIDPFGHDGKRGLFSLNEEYDRAGNILVGMNDIHVRAAMADPRVFFIIPWHASGMSNHILKQMFNILGVNMDQFVSTDYTKMQEETNYLLKKDDGSPKKKVPKEVEDFWDSHNYEDEFACGTGHIENGDHKGGLSKSQLHYRALRDAIFDGAVKEGTKEYKEIMADEFLSQVFRQVTTRVDDGKMTEKDKEFIYPYEYWQMTEVDENGNEVPARVENADVNGRRYVEYCRRMGFKPKFTGKYDDKTGYSPEGNFADDPGYWKLLIDRRMYDRRGNYQDLTPVDSSGLDSSMYDPEQTSDEFNVTEVATNEGAEKIAEMVYQQDTARTGTMPAPNLDMSMDEAVTKYKEVTALQASLIKAEREALKAADEAKLKAEKAKALEAQDTEGRRVKSVARAKESARKAMDVAKQKAKEVKDIAKQLGDDRRMSLDVRDDISQYEGNIDRTIDDAENAGVRFSIRTKPAPKKTIPVYKLMRLGDDGKLYPLYIDGAKPIELGTWYDADSPNLDMLTSLPAGSHLINNETGQAISLEGYYRQNGLKMKPNQNKPGKEVVKSTPNGMRWVYIEETDNKQRRFGGEQRRYWNIGINGDDAVETYSMRPGWHAGSLPTMRQIGKGAKGGPKYRDDRFVWVEGEMSADVDYNEEAQGNPDNDIPTHIPTDGFYLKSTNANAKAAQADRVGWYIGGAFKANRIMSDREAREVIDNWNAGPNHADAQVEYDYPRESGKVFNAETMQLEDDDNNPDGPQGGKRFSIGDIEVPELSKEARDHARENEDGSYERTIKELQNFYNAGNANRLKQSRDFWAMMARKYEHSLKKDTRAGLSDRWIRLDRFGVETNTKKAQYAARLLEDLIKDRTDYRSWGVKKNKEISMDEMDELFMANNKDMDNASLWSRVLTVSRQLGIDNIKFKKTPEGVSGRIFGGRIRFSDEYFNDNAVSDNRKCETMLHEMIHHVTVYALDHEERLNDVQKNAVKELKSVYLNIKEDPAFKGLYGITNVKEMVAELANPKFRDALKKKNLFYRIVESIRKIFFSDVPEQEGLYMSSNAYRAVLENFIKLLENFDNNAYNTFAEDMRKYRPRYSLAVGDNLATAATYFSGGGLVEEGLKGVIDPKIAVEYDRKLAGVYEDNHGSHIVVADVRDTDPLELAKSVNGPVEYFHASPVCKRYSPANTNAGETELDIETAQATANAISAMEPKVVTIENVAGYKDSEALKIITDRLTELGYNWDANTYTASDYGAYTKRKRLIVRAVKNGILPAMPEKTPQQGGWMDAVSDLIPNLNETTLPNWIKERAAKEGLNVTNPEKPLLISDSGTPGGGLNYAYGDELAPTILANGTRDFVVMPDGRVLEGDARFLARITGLSDDYKLPKEKTRAHTIIGNGVPPALMRAVVAPLIEENINKQNGFLAADGSPRVDRRGKPLTPFEREVGHYVAESMAESGIDIVTDIPSIRKVIAEAKKDNSEAGRIRFLKDERDKVVGCERNGVIYLDPRSLDAEAGLHEYSRLWTKAMRYTDPESWSRVVDALKKDADAWSIMKKLNPAITDENEIALEMIAKYTGEKGKERLEKEFARLSARENAPSKTIFGNALKNIADAINEFWRSLGKWFGLGEVEAQDVYDMVLMDFAKRVNPYARVEDAISNRDAEYAEAAERGDKKTAIRLVNEALEEYVGNGIVPYISVKGYADIRSLAKGVKRRDPAEIKKAARLMAEYIPDNAVLIPVPSHSGKATDMLDLANEIGRRTNSPVADVLVGVERKSQYQAKKEGSALTPSEIGIEQVSRLPDGKIPVFIDNVVNTGNTAKAAVDAVGKGMIVCLGSTSGSRYGRAKGLKSANIFDTDRNGKLIPLSERFDMGERGPRFSLGDTRTEEDGREVYTETRDDGTLDREVVTNQDGSRDVTWFDEAGRKKEVLSYYPNGEVRQVSDYDSDGDLMTRLIQYDENRRAIRHWEPRIGTDWERDENGVIQGRSNGVEIRPYGARFSVAVRDGLMGEANALQKVPGREVQPRAVEPGDVRFSLSRSTRETIGRWFDKRQDLSDNQKEAVMQYLDEFDDKKLQLTAARWFVNGTVRLPEDMPKVEQAVQVANKAKVDPLLYSSPMELINQFPQTKIKAKPIDPETVPTLRNGRDIGHGIRIYDVDNSEESRQNMRQIINTHFGEDASPWCLLQGDGNGNLTSESQEYWDHYDAYPKQVAFMDGKLLAFSANDTDDRVWWDRVDVDHPGVPYVEKVQDDALNRKQNMYIDPETGEVTEGIMFRGNQQNGLYECWYSDGTICSRTNYKDGKYDGESEHYSEFGRLMSRINYKGGAMDGTQESYYENGQLREKTEYKDGVTDGAHEMWTPDGILQSRVHYKDGVLDGVAESWHSNGLLKSRNHFSQGKTVGTYQEWYKNGQLRTRRHYIQGSLPGAPSKLDGFSEEWDENGIIQERTLYLSGKRIYSENRMGNGGTNRINYKDGLVDSQEDYNAEGNLVDYAEYSDSAFRLVRQPLEKSPHNTAPFSEEGGSDIRFSLSLGAPYQGSKGQIATRVVDALPGGKRFVDLFAGGGAVTHAAMLSGKYGEYRVNDINPAGMELFLSGMRGDYRDYQPRELAPEEFEQIKGTPEGLMLSYSGFGRNVDPDKDSVARRVRRVQRLEQLKPYVDQVESSNSDYRDVELEPGDVVYADIPYEGTNKTGYRKGTRFDKRAFSDWALDQDVPIYVSEQSMPEGWTEIQSIDMPAMRGAKRTERLFVQSKFYDQVRDNIAQYQTTPAGNIRFSLSGDGTVEAYNKAVNMTGRTFNVGGREVKPGITRYNFQEAFQDAILSVKKLQQVVERHFGIKLPTRENAWMYENRLSSINMHERKSFIDKVYEPMMKIADRILKRGVKEKELNAYLICKHGLERNRVFAERDAQAEYDEIVRNGGTADLQQLIDEKRQRDYSGLTGVTGIQGDITDIEAEAQRIVDEFEQRHGQLCNELWDAIRKATQWSLRKSYQSGMMSAATFDHVRNMFQYYVPLRGWSETTAEDVYSYMMGEHGAFNGVLKKAEGRTSVADDPLATIGNMAESALMQGNKNLLKQHLLRMAQNHPTDVCQVRDVWLVEGPGGVWEPHWPNIPDDATPDEIDQILQDHEADMQQLEASGQAKRVKNNLEIPYRIDPRHVPEHAVVAKVAGIDHVVYINGNPRAAQAINGQTGVGRGTKSGFSRLIDFIFGDIKRFYSSVLTSLNINFSGANFVRDLPHAYAMTFIKYGPLKAAEYIAKSFQVIPWVFKNQLGKSGNSQMDRYFQEFLSSGAVTGYAHINDVDAWKANNKRRMARLSALGKARVAVPRALGEVVNAIGWFSETLELIPRFTAFLTERQAGKDIATATKAAKDITTNFNKKGSEVTPGVWGAVANTLRYMKMFFNPIVQGMYQFVDVASQGKENKMVGPRMVLATLHLPVLGAIVPYLNQFLLEALGGDDDDDYWLINEYTRRNNVCIFTGNGYLKIPIAPVFREMYGLGEVVATRHAGKADNEKTTFDLIDQLRTMGSVEGQSSYNEWSLARFLLPEHFAPLIDVMNNENFTGGPIYYDNHYKEYAPEYTKAKKSTWSPLVAASKWLNEMMGGDEDIAADNSGKWLNPGVWQHLITNVGGGFAQLAGDVVSGITDITEGKEIDTSNMPVVKRFYAKSSDERAQWARFGIYKEFEKEYTRAKEKYQALDKRDLSLTERADEMVKFAESHPKAAAIYAIWEGGIKGADIPSRLEKLGKDDPAYWELVKEAVGKAEKAMNTGYVRAWEQKRKDRPDSMSDKELNERFDKSDNDSIRHIMADEISKRAGSQDYYGRDAQAAWSDKSVAAWEAYQDHRTSDDIKADAELSNLLKVDEGEKDKERIKMFGYIKDELNKIRRGKDATSRSAGVKGLGEGDDERIMEELRAARKQLIEDLKNGSAEQAYRNLERRTISLGLRKKPKE